MTHTGRSDRAISAVYDIPSIHSDTHTHTHCVKAVILLKAYKTRQNDLDSNDILTHGSEMCTCGHHIPRGSQLKINKSSFCDISFFCLLMTGLIRNTGPHNLDKLKQQININISEVKLGNSVATLVLKPSFI